MSSSLRTSPDHGSVAPDLPAEISRGTGHDNRGRFTSGNRCGQGNPAARQTAALRQALRAAISPDDITEIADILREMALDGNLSAIRLLLSYVIGRPGAPDQDDPEPESAPAAPPVPESPAPVVATNAPVPPGNAPPSAAVAPGPPRPASPASPPSATVVNGPAPRPPAPPPVPSDERPPMCARRRWPK